MISAKMNNVKALILKIHETNQLQRSFKHLPIFFPPKDEWHVLTRGRTTALQW